MEKSISKDVGNGTGEDVEKSQNNIIEGMVEDMDKDREYAKRFKNKLINQDGRRINWFWKNKIKPVSCLTYPGFTSQLNGYAPISSIVRIEIEKYMAEK
jgi:hypothetical protein